MTFGWTDIDDIALGLEEHHPAVDPMTVSFPKLRKLVETLPGFAADPDHPVNEQILEAVQGAWIEERQDAEEFDDEDADERGREGGAGRGAGGGRPHNPFR